MTFNQRIYERHCRQTLEEVLSYFHETHRQFMEMVEAMPEDEMLERGRYAFIGKGSLRLAERICQSRLMGENPYPQLDEKKRVDFMNAKELFQHWDEARAGLISALDGLTDAQLDFHPT